jgi:transcriptional regulator with XRE-family HTH domain
MDREITRCENVNMAPVKKQLRPLGPTFLKEWREKAKLDQEAAAAQLEISRTLLSKIENAKSPYSQRILEAAAEIYRCTPAELIAADPKEPVNFWRLFDRAEKLTGTDRARVLGIFEAALK